MKHSLPVLKGLYPTSENELAATKVAVDRLSEKADPAWIAQRVVKLLSHYFVADFHGEAVKAVAKDWLNELREFPDWAIEQACAWWVSRHNEHRRKKPLPGDISERALKKAGFVETGRSLIAAYKKYGNNPPAFLRAN